MAPKRPRSHQLEQESITALRAALPTEWVYRVLDQDYGVDGEIEVFDQAGEATGAKLLVQLKATDELELDDALTITLRRETCDYYSSLDLPVLIVRYHAPSGKLFVRWFHTFAARPKSAEQKTFSFTFEHSHQWAENTSERLVKELESYRNLRSPNFTLPVQFALFIEDKAIAPQSKAVVIANLENAFRPFRELIQLNYAGNNDDAALNKIEICEDRISISLSGRNGYTLETPEGFPPELITTTLHYDVLAATALALHWHGHSTLGARIISEAAELTHLKNDIRNVMAMTSCLAAAGHFIQAMTIAQTFFQTENLIDNAQAMMSSILIGGGSALSALEKQHAYICLRTIAESVRDAAPIISASMHYNCGNLLMSNQRFAQGVRHYRHAAKIYEDYQNRPYYWQELGGAFFETGHYSAAARAYKCALDLDVENRRARACYADSLMFRGQYDEALKEFSALFDFGKSGLIDSEWLLKRQALDHVIRHLNIHNQARSYNRGLAAFEDTDFQDPKAVRLAADEALQVDALAPLAWYNIGVHETDQGRPEEAMMAYLVTALFQPNDTEAWLNCIATAFNIKNYDVFSAAFFEAYRHHGAVILHLLQRQFQGSGAESALPVLEAIVSDFDTVLAEHPTSKEIRFHRPEGGYDLLVDPSS